MTILKSTISGVFLLFVFTASGQARFGAGLNIGRNNGGFELQAYSFDRLKVFAGANLRKYNSFSTRLGAGISIRPLSKQHNFWVNSSFEYKFVSTPTLFKDDVYYTYSVNKLNYWNIEGAYTFRIDKYFKDDNFILLEAKVISKQLLNQVRVEPFESNTVVYESNESRLRQYFYSGTLLSLGIKFVW